MKNENEERITLTKPLTRKDWRFLLVSSLLWIAALALLLPLLGLLNGALDSVRAKTFGEALCPCEEKHEITPEEKARMERIEKMQRRLDFERRRAARARYERLRTADRGEYFGG